VTRLDGSFVLAHGGVGFGEPVQPSGERLQSGAARSRKPSRRDSVQLATPDRGDGRVLSVSVPGPKPQPSSKSRKAMSATKATQPIAEELAASQDLLPAPETELGGSATRAVYLSTDEAWE